MSAFANIPAKYPFVKMLATSSSRTKSMFRILHTGCNVNYHFRDIYRINVAANLNYKHR